MSRLPLYGRQGKFTYRLLAMALFGQAIILSFFALAARGNAIAAGRPDDGQRLLWVGLGLLKAERCLRAPMHRACEYLVAVPAGQSVSASPR